MGLQFGCGAVYPVGEPGQVTGRHFRKEMMLQVEEHLEGDPVLHLPAQGACERSQSWCTVHTAKKEVMHCPIAMTPTWYQSAKPPESAKTKYTQRTPAA